MKKVLLAIFFSALTIMQVKAQTAKSETEVIQSTTVPTPAPKVEKTTLDTEESLKYIGNQLLFQMKKRLNLTTKEEEEKESKSIENKKFSLFGIEIEKG